LHIFPAANERLAIQNIKEANKKLIIVKGVKGGEKLLKDLESHERIHREY
jgi:hypothetical protein